MLFVYIILLVLFSRVIDAQFCKILASQGDCSFYRECVETKIPGGANGYSLSFGERYCKQFENNLDCFDSKVC